MPRDLFAPIINDQQQPRDLFEIDQASLKTDRQKAIAGELSRRGRVQIAPEISQSEIDEPGILDYLMHAGETVATIGTGMIAEPIAGIAGLAKTITSGPEVGAETIEQAREALTYQPRGEMTQRAMQKVFQPVAAAIEPVVSGYEHKVAEPLAEAIGPVAGAAAMTLPIAVGEILGLRGTRMAKKAALKRVTENIDVNTAYDELGRLLPEIKQKIQESGISFDEVKDILPETIPETAVKELGATVGEAATAKVGQQRQMANIAEQIQPSEEILQAAKEFGVSDQLLASHTSGNPTFVAIEQGLKSVPGSQLDATEKALIANLSKQADELIIEFGGTTDKASLSDEFRTKSRQVVADLEDQAENAYKEVNLAIPRKTPVETSNIIRKIRETADDLGGEEFLDASEKRLLNTLDPESNPTYARLDKFRKEIGQALSKKSGVFADMETGQLKQLYRALSEDQKIAADVADAGDLYDTARNLVVQRKGIEDQLVKTLGKDLTGDITAKAGRAILDLQKGNVSQFDKMIDNIPKEVGKDQRKSIISSALNNAFVQGSRAERSLNIPGFDDFMTGLKRNSGAKDRLAKELGNDSMRRLESFHTLINGIRKAQKSAITTGRVTAVPGMIDEVDSIVKRLWGTGKKVAAAEGVSSAIGVPGAGAAGVLGSILSASRTPRSIAADQLLASPKFRRLLERQAKGTLDTVEKLAKAEREIQKLKAYQKWKNSLEQKDLRDLTTIGIIGYLTEESTNGE